MSLLKNFGVITLLFLLSFSTYSWQYGKMKKVSESKYPGTFSTKLMSVDWDGDRVNDEVKCSSVSWVRIVSGKTKKTIYLWNGKREEKRNGRLMKRKIAGCDLVKVKDKGRVVIIATFYQDSRGERYPAPQLVLHKPNGKYRVEGLRKSNGNVFWGVIRGVDCIRYPEKLRKKGYGDGALCFFAGYRQSDKKTRTAVVKVTRNNYKVRIQDLSSNGGFIWDDGLSGTRYKFGTYRSCSGSNKVMAYNMMDGAFVDYNRDGLPDIVTVGQHDSVRAFTMVHDSRKPQGISFKQSIVHQARKGQMTEFLRVTAINKDFINPGATSCVYISGEHKTSNECGKVTDHIRCYHSGKWRYYDVPGGISSMYNNPVMSRRGDKLIIKGTHQRIIKGGYKSVPFTLEVPK